MRRRLNALLGQQNDQPEQSENGGAEDAESTTETTVFPSTSSPRTTKEGVAPMAPVFTRFSTHQPAEALLRHRSVRTCSWDRIRARVHGT